MAAKTTPARVRRAGQDIGSQLAAWRKLQDLTAQQVAERAGISRDTLRRLEQRRGRRQPGDRPRRRPGARSLKPARRLARPVADRPRPRPRRRVGEHADHRAGRARRPRQGTHPRRHGLPHARPARGDDVLRRRRDLPRRPRAAWTSSRRCRAAQQYVDGPPGCFGNSALDRWDERPLIATAAGPGRRGFTDVPDVRGSGLSRLAG
ncbi:helix-turn-helix domain-containing protein [Pseudokineococcus sp. 1T1Z-3]|uniref:helix-turn-helix domain-containing protein n=1 Tax=Pseudokineococcus sp. 1T1Z-3 TaxID=3132745 RepID=UPI00403F0C03